MGRSISCRVNEKLETVWRYLFGSQPSEMYRIYEELGVGEYHPFRFEYEDDQVEGIYEYLLTRQGADGDILILDSTELEELNVYLQNLQADAEKSKETRYIAMIIAIRDFMLRYPNQKEFVFESDF
jgi:hypothetical protein